MDLVVSRVELESGAERFSTDDLLALSDDVGAVWASAAHRDWSVPAGTVEWTCLATAEHAVDCVYAPAFFLASRRQDGYPEAGLELALGADASPGRLVQSLQIASRILAGVVNDAEPEVRAVIFRHPQIVTAAPGDFAPRGAMELILHAHDVCAGLQVPYEPSVGLCHRLREHTRPWPMWTVYWSGLGHTDDPWADLLAATGRARQLQ